LPRPVSSARSMPRCASSSLKEVFLASRLLLGRHMRTPLRVLKRNARKPQRAHECSEARSRREGRPACTSLTRALPTRRLKARRFHSFRLLAGQLCGPGRHADSARG
jgi:hypothetical protein